MERVSSEHRGPWPDVRPLIRRELAAYLATVSEDGIADRPTRCEPWTVRDVTAHLAATFERFELLLGRARNDGDLRPPFAPEELDAENELAVATFEGDPVPELRWAVDGFLSMVHDINETMPHQRGPIPVGLQLCFGLDELALHHDDVADALGRRYRPDGDVVELLAVVWQHVLGGLPGDVADPWAAILVASGREPISDHSDGVTP